MNAQIYYFTDKVCTLFYRDTGTEVDFVLEAPNGSGVFEIEINGLFDSKYVDGMGFIRNGYNEYEIKLNFNYSGHYMDLFKLMNADEVLIPWSFGLTDDRIDSFVLDNETMVYEFLHGLMMQFENPEDDIGHGGLGLSFTMSSPIKDEDLRNLYMFKEEDY